MNLSGHTALVTGANHGIGAATARKLAAAGASVLLTYLRLHSQPEEGSPQSYELNRARSADHVVEEINSSGGRAAGAEADLRDPATAPMVFDRAEREFGAVDILVNNASGWTIDTFATPSADRLGRSLVRVSADTRSTRPSPLMPAPARCSSRTSPSATSIGARSGVGSSG
jgi:3-oxoacyl-[acyl-carrier protein] reductase